MTKRSHTSAQRLARIHTPALNGLAYASTEMVVECGGLHLELAIPLPDGSSTAAAPGASNAVLYVRADDGSEGKEYIATENLPIGRLDALVTALQKAIDLGRKGGVLPPATSHVKLA
jgi:hypothetical protein